MLFDDDFKHEPLGDELTNEQILDYLMGKYGPPKDDPRIRYAEEKAAEIGDIITDLGNAASVDERAALVPRLCTLFGSLIYCATGCKMVVASNTDTINDAIRAWKERN